MENREAVAKALRPLRPAAGGVAAGDGEDRRALGVVEGVVDEPDLLSGEGEAMEQSVIELGEGGGGGKVNHGAWIMASNRGGLRS